LKLFNEHNDYHAHDTHVKWYGYEGVNMSAVATFYAVRQLLDDPSGDIRMNDDDALCASAKFGHADHVRDLLSRGANASARDGQALADASRDGYIHIVRDLLSHGADPEARDRLALGNAVLYNHGDVANLLIPLCHGRVNWANAQTRYRDTDSNVLFPKMLICIAAERNDSRLLRELFDHGATLHYSDQAIENAIKNGNMEAVTADFKKSMGHLPTQNTTKTD